FIAAYVSELEAAYVSELEAAYVSELEAYLQASGLDNYELTNNEQAALKLVSEHKIKWSEYRVGDLFDVDNLWIYGKNKNWKIRCDTQKENSLPVISGITVNNGVNYYTDDMPNGEDIFSDSLTISTRGVYSGTVTYHKGRFLLANNILVMQMPNYTINQKLFFGSLINNLSYGGYDGYPRKETLKNDIIQLPVKDGEIDFDFITTLVVSIQKLVIKDVVLYTERKIAATKKITGGR
ncbi:restriction endonuclease subunit S, partial [Canibacter sp. lx-72]|uniref:restriction endonuclease subunit S n=1 Tax=Canibacter zhuwentaonis TaxID=2837491 RepID=UPI001BDD5C22